MNKREFFESGVSLLEAHEWAFEKNKIVALNLYKDWCDGFCSNRTPLHCVVALFVKHVAHDEWEKVADVLTRLVGLKLSKKDGAFVITSEETPITIKGLGNKTHMSKLKKWSVIAEHLKNYLAQEAEQVKFFSQYEQMREYFTTASCSGGSCMRGSFSSLDFHPCMVYAQDAKGIIKKELYVDGYKYSGHYALEYEGSNNIELAVLFKDGAACARAVVCRETKTMGKVQGNAGSELAKFLGYSFPLDARVHLIRTGDDDEYLMPYIDGWDYVSEDGSHDSSEGVPANSTAGVSSNVPTVWSECEGEDIPEEEATYSEVMDDYIRSEDAVQLYEGGYCHPNWHGVYCSQYHNEYFVDTSDWAYSEYRDDWYLLDDVFVFRDHVIRIDEADSFARDEWNYAIRDCQEEIKVLLIENHGMEEDEEDPADFIYNLSDSDIIEILQEVE